MSMGTEPSADLSARRSRMVETQLRQRGIRNAAVLDVMAQVPRERFVLAEDRDQAYEDGPQAIGYGATISQPYIVALMTEALDLRPEDRVLEIGTGSGYQTAILAELVAEVFTIEIHEALSCRARAVLDELGYENIAFRAGDGRAGWSEAAPFDAILVAAAPTRVPGALLEQLDSDGRMVVPVGDHDQQLILYRRRGNEMSDEPLTHVRFVALLGDEDPTS